MNRSNLLATYTWVNQHIQLAAIVGRGAGVLAGLILTMQLPALAGDILVSQATSNDYPADEIQAYLDSCLSTATANGLSDTAAQSYCNCTITVIQKRFTYSQFVSFAESIQATQQLPNELLEVVQQCSPQ